MEPTSLVRVLMLPVGEKSSGDTPLPLLWPLGALILVPEALLCLGEGLEAWFVGESHVDSLRPGLVGDWKNALSSPAAVVG